MQNNIQPALKHAVYSVRGVKFEILKQVAGMLNRQLNACTAENKNYVGSMSTGQLVDHDQSSTPSCTKGFQKAKL